MKNPALILASTSPRRSFYLKQLGVPFRKAVPEVDERPLRGEAPRAFVRRMALEKARDVSERRPRDWVLAGDTIVVLDGEILGKPRDERHARRMLRRLSGRAHQVINGMALVSQSAGREFSRVSLTRVRLREIGPAEIRWYVQTGEPADKAGAYAIQGKGGIFVKSITGSGRLNFPVKSPYGSPRSVKLLIPPTCLAGEARCKAPRLS